MIYQPIFEQSDWSIQTTMVEVCMQARVSAGRGRGCLARLESVSVSVHLKLMNVAVSAAVASFR